MTVSISRMEQNDHCQPFANASQGHQCMDSHCQVIKAPVSSILFAETAALQTLSCHVRSLSMLRQPYWKESQATRQVHMEGLLWSFCKAQALTHPNLGTRPVSEGDSRSGTGELFQVTILLGFVSHVVSVGTTQFCHCSMKTAIDNKSVLFQSNFIHTTSDKLDLACKP